MASLLDAHREQGYLLNCGLGSGAPFRHICVSRASVLRILIQKSVAAQACHAPSIAVSVQDALPGRDAAEWTVTSDASRHLSVIAPAAVAAEQLPQCYAEMDADALALFSQCGAQARAGDRCRFQSMPHGVRKRCAHSLWGQPMQIWTTVAPRRSELTASQHWSSCSAGAKQGSVLQQRHCAILQTS